MNKEEVFDYFWDLIPNDKTIIELEGKNFYNKIVFNTLIALYENLVGDNPYDALLAKTIKTLTEENKKQGIYDILKKEYLFRYIKISIKSVDFPKYLKRIMYVPIRATVYELMIAGIASMNVSGEHLVSMYKRNIIFNTPSEEDTEGYNHFSAIDTYIVNIINMKTIKLWYDYGEDWIFDIAFKDFTYLDEYLPFKIIKAKGEGVYENHKYAYINSVEKGHEEFDFYDYSEKEDLEDLNDGCLALYDTLFENYL